jgi:hypothetical protein
MLGSRIALVFGFQDRILGINTARKESPVLQSEFLAQWLNSLLFGPRNLAGSIPVYNAKSWSV